MGTSTMTAWQESERLVAMGHRYEKALQQKARFRAERIIHFLGEGFTREEAERLAGESCLRGRVQAMVNELVNEYAQPSL